MVRKYASHMLCPLLNSMWRWGVIWSCIFAWQLMLVLFFLGWSVWDKMPIEGVVSYLFSGGYLVMECVGQQTWGPMSIGDVRWVLGASMMVCLSMLPFCFRTTWIRVSAWMIFGVVCLLGSLCTMGNIACVIT